MRRSPTSVSTLPAPPPGFPVPIEREGKVVAWAQSPELAVRLARALRPRGPRRLVGFRRKRMFLLDPARVVSFELRAGLVFATLDSGDTYSTNYTIRGLDHLLSGDGFFRAHRDVLLNLLRVTEIEKAPGKLVLVLDVPQDGGECKTVTCSRPASQRLRRLLRL